LHVLIGDRSCLTKYWAAWRAQPIGGWRLEGGSSGLLLLLLPLMRRTADRRQRCEVDMQNVLVTGGAGYIGSHACKALAMAGLRPIAIDNLCLGHREFVKWGPLVEADVRNTNAVINAIRTYNVTGVLHFAAFAYVGESVTNPSKYYENNVTGTLSILAAMRETGLKKFVFSSTCAVYGSPDKTPISEPTRTTPVNPYGRSKLACEAVIADYAAAYGLEPIVLRYFNASGAEPLYGIGEDRLIETHLIPRAMMALQGYISDFQVFGSDFPTPDGTAIRDYIHVSDLAEAHVLALTHLFAGGPPGTFNLGVGKGFSVKQVLDAISLISNRTINAPTGARRDGDPPELVADARLAQRVLGFIPKRSDLYSIVESAWQWHAITHPLLPQWSPPDFERVN
jgi:UDP-arabinose 4-epimerase